MSVVLHQPVQDMLTPLKEVSHLLLQKILLFVFAHAFTENLLLLQPTLEAVK